MLKQILTAGALVLVSQVTLGAQVSTCLKDVNTSCRGQVNIGAAFGQGKSECKIIQAGDRPETSGRFDGYDKKVVFFDNNSLISVEIPSNSRACRVSRAELAQGINDETVHSGRLYAAAGNGKVYVVARNNQIHELYNAKGKSYTGVKSISVNQQTETVTFTLADGNQPTLGLQQLLSRLNDGVHSKCIGGCN